MFHGKKKSNTHKSEDANGKGSCVKTYSKKKGQSKRPHSRKKNWESRIGNSTFKHGNYESDFVGAKRLTKCVGFLAKGKISDSISRLEKTMPEVVKARTEQDLLKILQFSNESYVKHQTVPFEITKQNCKSSQNEISFSSSCNSYHSPPILKSTVNQVNRFAYSINAPDSKFSAVVRPPESVSDGRKSELSFCKDIIVNRFHLALKEANKELFPGVSNLDKNKKEFLSVRNEYNLTRQTLSSSNNCESPQETFIPPNNEAFIKETFQLNPVLTREATAPKDLESMFPSPQEGLSSDSDVQVLEEPNLLNKSVPLCHTYTSESTSSPERVNGSLKLRVCSSASSSGSPVWKLEVSPVKFIPDLPPTPKIYYRQKMF